MRIPTLLQKISELATQPERRTAIDLDLMLDYTRVLYADLLEWRSRLPATSQQQATASTTQPKVEVNPSGQPQKDSVPVKSQQPSEPAHDAIEMPEVEGPSTIGKTPKEPVGASEENDVRSLIGINDKYQIMSELFGNDRKAYEQALDFINHSQSENMAMQWLREQLWITEERSDAAQSFFEIVSRYFRK